MHVCLKPLPLLACLTGVVSGAAALCLAIVELDRNGELLREGIRVEAQVMRIDARSHSDRISYEFRAPRAPGSPELARFRGGRKAISHGARLHAEASGRVEVVYDPRDPERNRVVDDGAAMESMLLLAVLTGWIGIPLWILARDLNWRRRTRAAGGASPLPERILFRVEDESLHGPRNPAG